MIGYFTKAGDVEVGAAFDSYRQSFRRLLKKGLDNKKYGDELDLILIEYHLEGKFLEFPHKKYQVLPYRKKERSLGVVVGVSRDFGKMSDTSKRQFIISTTIEAIKLAQEKMQRLGFHNIDFPQLYNDIEECSKEYLELPEIERIGQTPK